MFLFACVSALLCRVRMSRDTGTFRGGLADACQVKQPTGPCRFIVFLN